MVKKCQECLGNLGNLEIRHYFLILLTIHCQRSLVQIIQGKFLVTCVAMCLLSVCRSLVKSCYK